MEQNVKCEGGNVGLKKVSSVGKVCGYTCIRKGGHTSVRTFNMLKHLKVCPLKELINWPIA